MIFTNEKTNMEHLTHNFLVGRSENHVLLKFMFTQELAHRGRPLKIPSNGQVTRYAMHFVREHIMPTFKQTLRRGNTKDYVAKNIMGLYKDVKKDKERKIYDPNATVAQICLNFTESLVSPNINNYMNAAKSAMIRRIKIMSIEPIRYREVLKSVDFGGAITRNENFIGALMDSVKQAPQLYRSLTKLFITLHLHFYGKKMTTDEDGFYNIDTPWAYPEGFILTPKFVDNSIANMLTDILFVDIVSFLEKNNVLVDGYFGDDPQDMLKELELTPRVLRSYIIMAHNNLLEYSIALMDDHIADMIKIFVDDEIGGYENEEIMDN